MKTRIQSRIQAVTLICLVFGHLSIALSSAEANVTESFKVLVRGKKGKPKYPVVPLILVRPGVFESANFKIVLGKSSLPIPTQLGVAVPQEPEGTSPAVVDEELRLRAASVLYHLEEARRYFSMKLRSPEVRTIEPLTVRLDIVALPGLAMKMPGMKTIAPISHFQSDQAPPQYNDAVSIAGGTDFKDPSVKWSREIWFRPAKEIPLKEIMPVDPFNETIRDVNSSVIPGQVNAAIQEILYGLFSERAVSSDLVNSLTRQAGTVAVLEASLLFAKLLNRAATPNHYYLDTALIPEIIQHEYAHIALSDHVPLHSTPLTEGVADYFASDMQGSPIIGGKIKKYSPWAMKDGSKPKHFHDGDEEKSSATSDAVLSMLWGMRDAIGAENATAVIFEARKHLNRRDLNVKSGLIDALLRSCETVCPNPLGDRMTLVQYFSIYAGGK